MSPQLAQNILTSKTLKKSFKPETVKSHEIFSTDIEELDKIKNDSAGLIYLRPKINDLRYINQHLIALNKKMQKNGLLVCYCETLKQRSIRIKKQFGKAALFFLPIDFLYKRVAPKIRGIRKAYFYISKGHNRVLSKAEVLGRLHFCGYHLVKMEEIDNKLHLIVKKTQEPCSDKNPSYGPMYKKKSIGKDGKITYVYKLRTMHPYSEYLRDFILRRNGYSKAGDGIGKIDEDFRVTAWGRFFRKYWLDELPQIFNLISGKLKLIGVRPLSASFLAEYPEEFLEIRMKYKPGLLPPYAAHIHQSIDEYIDSERKYLNSYSQHPIRTDIKYFFWITYNILTNKIRSK